MRKLTLHKIIFLLCLTFPFNGNTTVHIPLSTVPEMQTAQWSKSWWLPRHESKLAKKKALGDVEIVFLGDSITHAFDNKGKAVWDKYYAPYKALNLGFSGDRTENVLWRLNHGEIDNIAPKLVVLMIGTNNTGHRQDKPQDTADGIKAIISKLKSKLPHTKVLLLAIFPRGASSNDPLRKINDEINGIIKTFHDGKHVFYRDINHLFLDKEGGLSKSIMTDLLHPNQDQYLVWAQALEAQINELTKK